MYQTANISQHRNGCKLNPKNIHKCLECGNDTNNPKFCNKTCSALFNNKQSKTGFKRQIIEKCHPMIVNAEYKTTLHRRICKKYWAMKCPICGWDKSVDVHHIDSNDDNNEPRNLIPLCQNHHTLTRMNKYKKEIENIINDLVNEKFGVIVQR